MSNIASPDLLPGEFFRLVRGGLLEIEYSPWPNLPMDLAIRNIIATNFTNPTYGPFLNMTDLRRLQEFIPMFAQDDISARTTLIYSIITAATILTVALRFYSRKRITGRLKPEDWCAAVALFFSILTTAMFIALNVAGNAGKHVWEISYLDARKFYILQMACALTFKVSHLPVKATFLICYYSLLPPGFFRKAVIAVFVLVICTTITGVCLVTLKCMPVDFWNDLAGCVCVNRILVFNIWGIFSVVGDFLILILPMPVVWKLKLSLHEKVLVTGVFSAGGVCVIASVNRLLTLDDFYRSPDMTYAVCINFIWTLLEVHLGLMISCVPALRSFINPSIRKRRAIKGSVAELSAAVHLRAASPGFNQGRQSYGNYSREDLERSSSHSQERPAMRERDGMTERGPWMPTKVYQTQKILPDAGVVLGD